MAFLRNLLATIVGLFVFSFLAIILFISIGSALSAEEVPVVKDKTVLYLKLGGILTERSVEDPLQELFPNAAPAPIGLMDVIEAIKTAKTDEKVEGIYMEHQFLTTGYASLEEIREALTDFKSSGKFVYSYGEYISETDYYLASVADSIILNPEGSLEFNGLSVNVTFWKGLFDKLDIDPVIFRVGEFKSYVEPFQQKEMSDENRLQLNALLGSIYGHYLDKTASSRSIDRDRIEEVSDQLLIHIPEDAVEVGLVDKLGYEDEIISVISRKVGVEDREDINFMGHKKYVKAAGAGEYSPNKIAVIFGEGNIVMGGDDNTIVGEKFAEEIRKARESSSVKAIVLRVNSPGGSLTASDMIWREVQKTKGVKPIIASMSDVAASGGYYISMGCDSIFAQPNTITGSIGIFGLLFNIDEFLENKLGITNDVVNTGEHSDIMTVTRDLTEYEKEVIQKGVEKGYETFVTKAAKGRSMSVEEIKEVASGRVWSGLQAKENGLVDQLGNLDDAIAAAARMADIEEDYRVRYYPEKKPWIEEVLSQMNDEADVKIFGGSDNPFNIYRSKVEELNSMKGIQARMPWDLSIQ